MNASVISASTPARLATQSFLYSVLLLLGCAFNGAIIWLVHKHRSLQTVTHLWVISLCWSHLLTSSITIPLAVISTASNDWLLGKEFCQISGYSAFVFRTVSIVSIAGIAVDRYHVISRPFSKRMQKKTAKILIVFTWWSSLVACTPPLLGVGLYRYSPNHHMCQISWVFGGPGFIYTIFYITAIYFSTVLTTLCSYHLIHKVTQKQAMKRKRAAEGRTSKRDKTSLSTVDEDQASDRNQTPFANNRLGKILTSYYAMLASRFQSKSISYSRSNVDRKANQIILLVLLVFLIAWTPYFVYALHSATSGEERTNFSAGRRWLEFIVTWLSLSTCIWDPLLYAAFTKNFKSHFWNLISCFCNPLRGFPHTSVIGNSSSSKASTKIDTTAQDGDGVDQKVYRRQRSRITAATEISCDIHDDYYFEQSPATVGSLSEEVLHTLSQSGMTSSLRKHCHSKRNRKLTVTSAENASSSENTHSSSQAIVEVRHNKERSQKSKFGTYNSSKVGNLPKATLTSRVYNEKGNHEDYDKEMASPLTSKIMSIADERKMEETAKVEFKQTTVKFLMIKTSSQNVTPTKEIALKPINVNERMHDETALSPSSRLNSIRNTQLPNVECTEPPFYNQNQTVKL